MEIEGYGSGYSFFATGPFRRYGVFDDGRRFQDRIDRQNENGVILQNPTRNEMSRDDEPEHRKDEKASQGHSIDVSVGLICEDFGERGSREHWKVRSDVGVSIQELTRGIQGKRRTLPCLTKHSYSFGIKNSTTTAIYPRSNGLTKCIAKQIDTTDGCHRLLDGSTT